MQKTTLRVMTLFLMLTLPQAVVAGSLTYSIVDNGPYFQNGWSLSGTIVTDGIIGPIGSSDITYWEWMITNGEQTYTASSSDYSFPPSQTTIVDYPVLASSTEITLPFPGDSEHGGPFGFLSLGIVDTRRLVWYYFGYGTSGLFVNSSPGWDTMIDTTDDIIVATAVPEPSSLYLLGFGAVCGSVYVTGHKRRERSTA